jgi:Mn-containing catalase
MKEFFFRKALDEIEDRFANKDLPPDTQTLLKTLRKRKYNHHNALQQAKRVFDIAAMPSLRELSSIAKNAG